MATAGIADDIGWWSRIPPWLCLSPAALSLGLALVSYPTIAVESWMRVHVDTIGWLSFVAAAGLRWWSALHLASEPRGLVTTGPYSVCRNPILLANLLLGLSLALFLGNATFALGFAAGAVGCFSMMVSAEERELARVYGLEYRTYRERVPRFAIRLRTFQSPESLTVDRAILLAELRLTILWMWLPVIGKMLAQLRAEAWWPNLLDLP